MEVFGKSMVSGHHTNVIFLSSILGQDGPHPVHKCDWKCGNEHVCGNVYRCKLTGLTHICDKNCNQRILYDNHSSLCRVSKQVFPLTAVEQQAVRGVRRKLDADGGATESCGFKRRRDVQYSPSPFEKSFSAVGPICSPAGEGKICSPINCSSVKECTHIIVEFISRSYKIVDNSEMDFDTFKWRVSILSETMAHHLRRHLNFSKMTEIYIHLLHQHDGGVLLR